MESAGILLQYTSQICVTMARSCNLFAPPHGSDFTYSLLIYSEHRQTLWQSHHDVILVSHYWTHSTFLDVKNVKMCFIMSILKYCWFLSRRWQSCGLNSQMSVEEEEKGTWELYNKCWLGSSLLALDWVSEDGANCGDYRALAAVCSSIRCQLLCVCVCVPSTIQLPSGPGSVTLSDHFSLSKHLFWPVAQSYSAWLDLVQPTGYSTVEYLWSIHYNYRSLLNCPLLSMNSDTVSVSFHYYCRLDFSADCIFVKFCGLVALLLLPHLPQVVVYLLILWLLSSALPWPHCTRPRVAGTFLLL